MAAIGTVPDFIREKGLPFFAHLLRRLADRMIAEAGEFYVQQGISAPARTASTLLLLSEQGPQSVTELSTKLRQSHPLVISWIRQLTDLGLVVRTGDRRDRRRTVVSLSAPGADEAARMAAALDHLAAAYRRLLTDAGMDVFDDLWRLDEITARGELLSLLLAGDD
jgi:DNA-binding MarR family transcriptional regulator